MDEQELWNESEPALADGLSETVESEDDFGDEAYEPEAEEEGVLSAEAVTADESDEPAAPAINVPLLSVDDGSQLFTPEEQEQLNEMVLNGQFAQANQIVWARQQNAMLRTTQRLMQAQTVYGSVLSRAETEFPEVFATHGNTIRQIAASASPDQAGNPAALFGAIVAPFILEVQAGADPIKTAARMGRMLTRQAQAASPAPERPAQPSARVAPTGSRGGSAPVTRGRTPGVIRDMMELFGAEEGDVRRALDAAKGR